MAKVKQIICFRHIFHFPSRALNNVVLGSVFGAFWLHVGLIGSPRGSLRLPMGGPRAFFGPLFQHLFFLPFFDGFWVPPGSPKPGADRRATHPLAVWENTILAPILVKSSWENSILANSVFPTPLEEGNY